MRKTKNDAFPFDLKENKKGVRTKKGSPENLLDAFERIVELVHDSEMNDKFFQDARESINYITGVLDVTDLQAVLLSVFVDKSEDSHIRPSEIASYIGVRTVRMLQYMEEIDGLVEKHYIKASKRNEDIYYHVPISVLKALRQNKAYEYVEMPVNDTHDFFECMKMLVKEKDNDEIDYNRLESRTMELLEEIKDTHFAKSLERLNLTVQYKMLFVFMAHLYVNNDDNNIRLIDIEDLYDDDEIPFMIRRELKSHSSLLFSLDLIENVNDDGMARSNAYKLTDKAKDDILSEVSTREVGKSREGLLRYDSLVEKNLVYNAVEKGQIKELVSILSAERFAEVQSRLKSSGMRQGFCCIFYGSPGTGKTETVYQIARQTGRDIMQVDVDKIKSCWVGESEKNIKSLFDRYRALCHGSDKMPILLFNEADAVLGTRMEGASRAVDKMENSIQNIILQEMEKLDGIMIATTNLTSNLDKAFERRFLYKVKFEKPSVEARAEIWRAMLPALKKKDAITLASKFDLSGGEIENVVRRHTVQVILNGNSKVELKSLEEACRLERLSNAQLPKIGF